MLGFKTPAFYKEERLLKYYQHQRYHFDCDEPPFEKADVLGLLSSIKSKVLRGASAKDIQHFIRKGEIGRTLELLLNNRDASSHDEFILLSGKYAKAKKELRKGTIDQAEFELREAQVSSAILDLVRDMDMNNRRM